jgi:2-methylfumaryl-CoA isomerase
MTYKLLNGVRVIESSAFIAAPMGGLTLAQYGADVIRVEMIGGGIDYLRWPVAPSGRSIYWTGLNKGKRSIAIDLRKPQGREIVAALATAPQSGILLTNVAAPWLTHAGLAAKRPDMITCIIEGNPDGTTAVDYTVNCATGYPFVTGNARPDAPVNHVLPAWDIACAMQGAFAVLAAHMQRLATGKGAEIRISLADVAFSALSHLGVIADAELFDEERPQIGNHVYGSFGRDFGCADGERVMVAAISSRQWQSLVEACDCAEALAVIEQKMGLAFSVEADRYAGREEIAEVVAAWIGARKIGEVAARFDATGVCWGRYRTARELVADDWRVSTKNPIFSRIQTPGVGEHLAAGPTPRFADVARGPVTPAPLLGEHTDAVLSEVLGLSGEAIGNLHDSGIVAGPERDPTFSRRAP